MKHPSESELLTDGLDAAITMMHEGEATAVIIVAVHRGGHGVRLWCAGDVDDQEAVKDKLMRALPLPRKKGKSDES